MSVRKLSLEEWFLYHQLKYLNRHYFHLPALVEADLSRLYAAYEGRSFPLSFILVKALALTLKYQPGLNRQFVHSWLGLRLLESQQATINLPVMLQVEGQDYLSVTSIKEADSKSVAQIQAEVRAFRQTPKDQLPIGKLIIGKPNTWFNRLRLRLVYALVTGLPQLQDRLGAGLASVSSLLNTPHEGTAVWIVGRGPGAVSLTACHFDQETGLARIALAFDHYALSGLQMAQGAETLCRILQLELEPEALLN
jgi:hypothetical protein